MTASPPTTAAIMPLRMESAPSDGPTVRSSSTVTGAGREPARRTMARSCASLGVKCPVMLACPPPMRSLIAGALCTFPSSTMAMRWPICSPVTRSKVAAPRGLKLRETLGWLSRPSKVGRASETSSPVISGSTSNGRERSTTLPSARIVTSGKSATPGGKMPFGSTSSRTRWKVSCAVCPTR